MPTALLSAHTGGFGLVFKRDLTQDMQETLDHWQSIPLRFDAIHVGYLAGQSQLPLVRRAIDRYRTGETLLFVDPVMGDWGKRYQGCPGRAGGWFSPPVPGSGPDLPQPH